MLTFSYKEKTVRSSYCRESNSVWNFSKFFEYKKEIIKEMVKRLYYWRYWYERCYWLGLFD